MDWKAIIAIKQVNGMSLLSIGCSPSMDGVTICRKIREEKKARYPFIMLTAKDSESDQVLGLEMGADDYVTKPFSPLALMARIKAVTRRYQVNKRGKS